MIEVAKSALLRAVGIQKKFVKGKNDIHVLRGVDFSLLEGETVAITGPSGVGKSTLLHILGTLENPTVGKILYGPENKDLFAMKDAELAKFRNQTLGFVFQFHYLLPEFNAVENVMMPALIAGYSKKESLTRATELLKFVGLSHRLDHRPAEMSGGEQQRVAIARAIMLQPKVLLADELTGNLDSTNTQSVLKLLQDLNKQMGVSIVLVTHDLNLAAQMRRQIVMSDGMIVKSIVQ